MWRPVGSIRGRRGCCPAVRLVLCLFKLCLRCTVPVDLPLRPDAATLYVRSGLSEDRCRDSSDFDLVWRCRLLVNGAHAFGATQRIRGKAGDLNVVDFKIYKSLYYTYYVNNVVQCPSVLFFIRVCRLYGNKYINRNII